MNQNFVDEINAEEFMIESKATIKQLDPHSHFTLKKNLFQK